MRRVYFAALALLLLDAGAAELAPTRGSLLVAGPDVAGREFAQSVVLLLHHGDEGSLGLILNRPTELRARELLDARAELNGYDETVFVGGPVAPTAIAVLARGIGGTGSGAQAIVDDLYVHSDLSVLAEVPPREARALVRLYAGHAAWEAGQLETEIARGDWQVVGGTAEHVFSAAPLTLWRRLLRLEGETLVEHRPDGEHPPMHERPPAVADD
jgi:putative transcriptional regulator